MSPRDYEEEYIRREKAEFPRRTVAVLLLVDAWKRIFLVRTTRLPDYWQPPGGGVKPADGSPEAAVQREVQEEVGIDIADVPRKLFEAPYDFGQGVVYFFVAPAPEGLLIPNKNELVSWRWFTLNEAVDLPMFPATRQCLRYLASHPEVLREFADASERREL